MRPPIVLFTAIAALVLSGCAQVGPKHLDDVGRYLSLRPGVSTKHDVYASFGQPHDVVYQAQPPSPSTWTYWSADMHPSAWTFVPYIGVLAGGSREETTTATFFFDPANRFSRLQTSKDSSYTNQWIGITRGIYRYNTDTKAARVEQEMRRFGKPFDKNAAQQVAERR